jgi:xanthine dehydrogenase molybdopterin-binding subunit B
MLSGLTASEVRAIVFPKHFMRAFRMQERNSLIGAPVERREDLRFLRGAGTYVADLTRPNLLYGVILRSPVAHGHIRKLDVTRALAMPGVHSVITADDLAPHVPKIALRLDPLPEFKVFEQPVIAYKKVRYVGEPVAFVLARSMGGAMFCCSRRTGPIHQRPSLAFAATSTLHSRARPIPARRALRCTATQACPWKRGDFWPNGTARRVG